MLLWGVLVGLGTGSMALAFVATVAGRWFVTRRGLVTGVLTAGGATGQLDLPAGPGLAGRAPRLALGGAGGRRRRAGRRPARAAAAARPPGRRRPAAVRRGRDRGAARPRTGNAAPQRARRPARRRRGPGRSGCSPAASRSAARRPTAWSARTSSPPRTTTACRRPRRPACSPWSGCSTSPAPSRPAGSPTGSTRGCCSAATTRCAGCSLLVLLAAVRGVAAPEHAGLHHLLRAGLGGHRAADGRAVPGVLRRRAGRSCSAGCSPRTRSARRSPRPPPA